MQLQLKPYPWACLATSFAMALNITTEKFFDIVGHDGSEIIFPSLPDPQCRRGFHISEAVLAATWTRHSASPIELMPMIAPTWDSSREPNHPVFYRYGRLGGEQGNFNLFKDLIRISSGVLECRTSRGAMHAVAYSDSRVYDPDGREFLYSKADCETRGLYPIRLWRVSKVI